MSDIIFETKNKDFFIRTKHVKMVCKVKFIDIQYNKEKNKNEKIKVIALEIITDFGDKRIRYSSEEELNQDYNNLLEKIQK